MVKIPTYQERIQAQTQQPTSLGPRASVGAFTSQGQAMASLGRQVTQSGQTIANNMNAFQKQKDKIAYEFAMQEKNLETERVQKEVDTFVSQEMANWTRDNTATTVTDYQAQADQKAKELRTQALGKYENSLTNNQLSSVTQTFNKTFALQRAQGSGLAFAKQTKIRKDQFDTWSENTRIQLGQLNPDSDAYKALMEEVETEYAKQPGTGVSPAVSLKEFKKSVGSDFFISSLDGASDQNAIEAARAANEADTGISGAERAKRFELIDSREIEVQADMVEGVYQAIISADDDEFTEQQVTNMVQMIRDKEEIYFENFEGEEQFLNISQPNSTSRQNLINRLTARGDAYEQQLNSTFTVDLARSMDGMSLAELTKMDSNLQQGKGRFSGLKDAQFNAANRLINSALSEAQAKALRGAKNDQDDLIALITKQKGQPSDEITAKTAQIMDALTLADRPDLAEDLRRSVAATTLAATTFESVIFASPSEKKAARDALFQNTGDEVGRETYLQFLKLEAEQQKEMSENFVGYYETQRGKRPSTEQLVTIQQNMGIAPTDIRVTSNEDLDKFQNAFNNPENTYADKGRVAQEFLAQYGIHGNRVMRHLMTTGTITLADNLIMAYPNDVSMKAISIFNDESMTSRYKSELDNDQRKEISAAATEAMRDYGHSILGGVSDDVLGGGMTGGRTNHVMAMRDIVTNTAQGYLLTGQVKTPEEAVELAYKNAIGSKFNFETVNNQPLRIEAGKYQFSSEMASVLQESLTVGIDNLTNIVEPPPTPAGASEQEAAALDRQYFSDLKQFGTWRTTTDNTGAYLVDQLGNMVVRKDATGQDTFVTIKFDQLNQYGQGYAQAAETGTGTLDDKRSAYMRSIIGNIF